MGILNRDEVRRGMPKKNEDSSTTTNLTRLLLSRRKSVRGGAASSAAPPPEADVEEVLILLIVSRRYWLCHEAASSWHCVGGRWPVGRMNEKGSENAKTLLRAKSLEVVEPTPPARLVD